MSTNNIFIAGHNGMVGSAILKKLKDEKKNVLFKKRSNLNLLDQNKVFNFFKKKKINELYICAAKVGGIYANSNYPANFIYENLAIASNLIHAAYLNKIKKILYLGSSCIYPKNIKRPISEKDLLNGKLETTNEFYSIAKIAGIKLAQSYNKQYNMDIRCVIPNNLYGLNDNYDEKNSHVVPALIRKLHLAKENNKKKISLWGTGKPKRELLYTDDLANLVYKLMTIPKKKFRDITAGDSIINIGSGNEYTIKNLAELISKTVGYNGKVLFNLNKLDGVSRKFLNTSRQKKLRIYPKINIKDGLKLSYRDFLKNNK